MREQTEQNINEAIDWIQQTATNIQDFALEQAPIYCQEVIAWEFWGGMFISSIGCSLVLLGYMLFGLYINGEKNSDKCPEDLPSLLGLCFGPVTIAIGFWVLLNGVFDSVKAKVAPRMVIIEHLQKKTQ